MSSISDVPMSDATTGRKRERPNWWDKAVRKEEELPKKRVNRWERAVRVEDVNAVNILRTIKQAVVQPQTQDPGVEIELQKVHKAIPDAGADAVGILRRTAQNLRFCPSALTFRMQGRHANSSAAPAKPEAATATGSSADSDGDSDADSGTEHGSASEDQSEPHNNKTDFQNLCSFIVAVLFTMIVSTVMAIFNCKLADVAKSLCLLLGVSQATTQATVAAFECIDKLPSIFLFLHTQLGLCTAWIGDCFVEHMGPAFVKQYKERWDNFKTVISKLFENHLEHVKWFTVLFCFLHFVWGVMYVTPLFWNRLECVETSTYQKVLLNSLKTFTQTRRLPVYFWKAPVTAYLAMVIMFIIQICRPSARLGWINSIWVLLVLFVHYGCKWGGVFDNIPCTRTGMIILSTNVPWTKM